MQTGSYCLSTLLKFYLLRSAGAAGTDPLEFWQQHSATFPVISQLANLYLAMSAASVPVESMFSTTGLILNSKRCMLAPDKLNKISFVHDNYNYLFN